jgi:programmed cell death protein 5
MSQGPDDDRLEKLREEKMQELQQQQGDNEAREEAMQAQQEQAEAQKNALLKQHLTDGARKRLNTVKMSRPDFGEKVEQQVLALAQSGRLRDKIDEDKMKELLNELKPDNTSFNIERR